MEHSPDLAAASPAGLVASARESMAVLSETLWAAALYAAAVAVVALPTVFLAVPWLGSLV